jgi:RNA polymerase sigma factor (sigma-70 family)
MHERTLKRFLTRVRRDLAPNGTAVEVDRDLLRRFLNGQDEAAFEALVRRHDRLVRSAIAKVLSHPHDAEDAFQATFLVLVRRARSIAWRAGLGPWLYGVAHRVAVKARHAGRTRVRKEKGAPARPCDPGPPDLSLREACALLHAELDALPDRYRLPLLLCYLEGKTRDEAAAALGVSPGTLKGRLERGRRVLRDRLARRGVSLSVGLLAALAAGSAGASPPSAVSALVELARGPAPDHLLALTREATMYAVLTKLTKTLVVLIGVVAAASAVLTTGAARSTDPAQDNEKALPPAARPAAGAAKTPGKAVSFVVNVLVKTPGGKPAAGANVAVWANRKEQAAGKTDERGRLDLTVPTFFPRVMVVATAPGFAPDWAPFSPVFLGRQVVGGPTTLTLGEAGPALEGHVTDLQGRPAANLPVDVERVGRAKPGRTFDEHIQKEPERPVLVDLDSIPAEAAGLPGRVTTDRDGRFRVTGVGKDRSVQITTRGEATAHLQVRVVTRAIDAKLERHTPLGLYGPKFTLRVGPSRPIVGTVRDAKTDEGVPGMKVTELTEELCETVTDRDGKFRLVGLKKEKSYQLGTGSLGAAPYLDANLRVDDTAGLGPISLDIKVHRGVVVTGRVTDSAGRPVAGYAFYDWAVDNPHLKDFPGIEDAHFLLSPWGNLDRDGRYRLLVVPGRVTVGACARPEEAFTRLDRGKLVAGRPVNRFPHDAIHAVADMDVNPKDPRTLTHDFMLTAGKARALVIRGAGGRLPAGLFAVGQSEATETKPVAGDTVLLRGLVPGRSRAVVLIDEAKALGAVAAVAGDAEMPVTITLQKLGSITGRVLDTEGPAASAEVHLWLVLDPRRYDNLPSEFSGVFGVEPGAWQDFTGRATRADKDGQFTITGLLPGQRYRLVAGYNLEKPDREVLHVRSDVTVKPGEAAALGELKPQK